MVVLATRMGPLMGILAIGACLAVPGLTAQAAPPPAQNPGTTKPNIPAGPKRYFVDSVVASVNDSSILQSKLFQASLGPIAGAEAEGRKLSLNDMRNVTINELRRMVGSYQMAQSARSFGHFPPDQFDMILRNELERDKQDRVRDLGTEFAFSEELARTGQTWQTYEDDLRIEKLTMLAEQFAIYERLRKQSNLYLTPRMLRETYQEFRSQFEHPVSADVAQLVFTGPEAEKNALAATEHWRAYNWTATEVAAKYPNAKPLFSLPASSLGTALKAFGLAGPKGHVSALIRGPNGTIRIAKILRHTPASGGRFEDRLVQEQVRLFAKKKLHFEFRGQALKRAQDRTRVWVYQNGRRVKLPK